MKDKFKRFAPITIFILLLLNIYIWGAYLRLNKKDLELFMLNIGQGDAFFIKTPYGQDILIDGGPGKAILSELGKAMPFYDRYIDLVIATHPDLDHIGGLVDVTERYRVGKIVINGASGKSGDYDELNELIAEREVPVVVAQKGQVFNFGDYLKMDILAPRKEDIRREDNNGSIVSLLDFNDFEVLFTGDAEETEWEKILAGSNFLNEKIEILKVSHHGSRNGTNEKVLEKIKPEIGLISSGKGNRYSHPHKEVLDLLEKFNVKILRTDERGTVKIESDGRNYLIK